MREDGPGDEHELAPAVRALVDHARAGDVGRHEVDGELDAVEAQVEGLRERADDERLPDAGDALDERVPAREEGDKDRLDGGLVADHDLGDLAPDRGEGLAEVLDGGRGDTRRHGDTTPAPWAKSRRTRDS